MKHLSEAHSELSAAIIAAKTKFEQDTGHILTSVGIDILYHNSTGVTDSSMVMGVSIVAMSPPTPGTRQTKWTAE